jgi:hypothetical protein
MVLRLSRQATVHAAVAKGLAEHGPKSKDTQGFTKASKQWGLISCRILACKWRSASLSNVSHSGELGVGTMAVASLSLE